MSIPGYHSNKRTILFLVVLAAIVIIMNLISAGVLPLNRDVFNLLIIILLLWISIGIALILRWAWLVYRPIELP